MNFYYCTEHGSYEPLSDKGQCPKCPSRQLPAQYLDGRDPVRDTLNAMTRMLDDYSIADKDLRLRLQEVVCGAGHGGKVAECICGETNARNCPVHQESPSYTEGITTEPIANQESKSIMKRKNVLAGRPINEGIEAPADSARSLDEAFGEYMREDFGETAHLMGFNYGEMFDAFTIGHQTGRASTGGAKR